MSRIEYRTEVAGIEVEVREQPFLDGLFRELGGKVVAASDKGLTMEFASACACAKFAAAAKSRGAIIDRAE